jgi:hypothetical protein
MGKTWSSGKCEDRYRKSRSAINSYAFEKKNENMRALDLARVTAISQSHILLSEYCNLISGAKIMEKSESVLKPVSADKAFYFFTSIGNYTGKSASSLKEFAEKVKEVDLKSLDFHLRRGDFEKWASGVLKDEELAKQLNELRETSLQSDNLREQLHSIIWQRISQLTHKPQIQQLSSPKTQTQWKKDDSRRRR